MDELVVLFMREFGWSLEYTVKLVKELPIKKLNAIADELKYQRSLEQYERLRGAAMIAAILTSTQNRKYKVTDFIGQSPRRKGETSILTQVAKKAGIKLPEETK